MLRRLFLIFTVVKNGRSVLAALTTAVNGGIVKLEKVPG